MVGYFFSSSSSSQRVATSFDQQWLWPLLRLGSDLLTHAAVPMMDGWEIRKRRRKIVKDEPPVNAIPHGVRFFHETKDSKSVRKLQKKRKKSLQLLSSSSFNELCLWTKVNVPRCEAQEFFRECWDTFSDFFDKKWNWNRGKRKSQSKWRKVNAR